MAPKIKKETVEATPDTTVETAPVMPQSEITSITFAFKNGYTRTFDAQQHGSNFVEIAAEFEQTNKARISTKTVV
jgi:hypothetical protein